MNRQLWTLILLGVVTGRLVVYEQQLVGEGGLEGHSWTVTDDSDNPSMVAQMHEFHSQGLGFDFTGSDFISQALAEMAWMNTQFDILTQLQDRMSCAHHYMINEVQQSSPLFGEPMIIPPADNDQDALFKYMSYNRFQPASYILDIPLDNFDEYNEEYDDYSIDVITFDRLDYENDDLYSMPVLSASSQTQDEKVYEYEFENYDDVYEQETDQVACVMLTVFLTAACMLVFVGVFSNFTRLAQTIRDVRDRRNQLTSISEDKVDLKTALLTPLEPEPAKGVVVAADHVKTSGGGRYVEVVYAPLNGE
eukprot:TRINITY_DN13738_c0_g2_i1.p1 TRINITY_DN13738_c0_g2~~TRINITY_DN13738_c0_g2_i1.p1  ORF type:complete len:350 (-),score=40.46 TRINITY_DN13738_c0_g2_i1:311-1231(-)